MVAHVFAPSLVIAVAVAALVLGGIGRVSRKPPPPRDVESIVVHRQVERAKTIEECSVIVLGDSSALMGVDAPLLQAELGTCVQSLATIGFVGPSGYARILGLYGDRHPVRTVVFLMHGSSLSISESLFAYEGFEALDDRRPPKRSNVPGMDALFDSRVAPLLDLPLPGEYGRHYGWPVSLSEELDARQGSLTDPNQGALKLGSGELNFTDAVRSRLAALQEALTRLEPETLWVDVTPVATSNTEGRRFTEAVASEFVQALGPNARRLGLPSAMPDKYFATSTHLNAVGQTEYTELLAVRMRAARPPP